MNMESIDPFGAPETVRLSMTSARSKASKPEQREG